MARIGSKKPIRWYVKEWRHKLKLSQEQVAERLGTNKGQFSKLERGKTKDGQRLNDDWIAAIAEAYGIEPADLLRDPDAPSPADILRDQPKTILDLLTAPAEVKAEVSNFVEFLNRKKAG